MNLKRNFNRTLKKLLGKELTVDDFSVLTSATMPTAESDAQEARSGDACYSYTQFRAYRDGEDSWKISKYEDELTFGGRMWMKAQNIGTASSLSAAIDKLRELEEAHPFKISRNGKIKRDNYFGNVAKLLLPSEQIKSKNQTQRLRL